MPFDGPIDGVDEVVVHLAGPLLVSGVEELLAEALGPAVVDAEDRVAAVGKPLMLRRRPQESQAHRRRAR